LTERREAHRQRLEASAGDKEDAPGFGRGRGGRAGRGGGPGGKLVEELGLSEAQAAALHEATRSHHKARRELEVRLGKHELTVGFDDVTFYESL